ncbi:MAG: hypothetical protein PVJ92_02250 [Candidatus Dependentiae bacterium]|jgi:hypothetical protein
MSAWLPAFNPTKMVDLAQFLFPETERVGCVYSTDPGNLDSRMRSIIDQLQSHCDAIDMGFTHGGALRNEPFKKSVEKVVKNSDAVFAFPDTLSPEHSQLLAKECYANSTFVMGTDVDLLSQFAGVLRVNLDKIIDTIWQTLKIASDGAIVPPKLQRKLSFKDIYAFQFFTSWFDRRLKEIPKDISYALRVPVLFDEVPPNDDDGLSGGQMTMEEILERTKPRRFKPRKISKGGVPGNGVIEINEDLFVWYGIVEPA